jgi:tRNA 2-thiouridine synthesizing protein A
VTPIDPENREPGHPDPEHREPGHPDPSSPIEVDARGLRCPLPVIRLAEAARDAAGGSLVVILATDPAARHDIPAWCRLRNAELVGMTEISGEQPEYLRFVVRVPTVRPVPR